VDSRTRDQFRVSLRVLESGGPRDCDQWGKLVYWCWRLPTLAAQSSKSGVGRPATPEQIRALGVSIGPDGTGLPEGSGTVAAGREVFAARCSRCHGEKAEGAVGPALVGGRGTLATAKPVKTVGSFWPYATTVWDYIDRAMPFDQPGSLRPPEVYALVAYILNLNDIIDSDQVMDAKSLPKVKMPNRDGFVPDPRPGCREEDKALGRSATRREDQGCLSESGWRARTAEGGGRITSYFPIRTKRWSRRREQRDRRGASPRPYATKPPVATLPCGYILATHSPVRPRRTSSRMAVSNRVLQVGPRSTRQAVVATGLFSRARPRRSTGSLCLRHPGG
jgi:cytochrome c